MMSAPASARANAIDCPIPLVPPVINAVLPSSENIFIIDSMMGLRELTEILLAGAHDGTTYSFSTRGSFDSSRGVSDKCLLQCSTLPRWRKAKREKSAAPAVGVSIAYSIFLSPTLGN
jgi:hypothetical protein